MAQAEVSRARGKGELFGAEQRVYDAVFDAVMAHRLRPGTRLVESAVMRALDLPRAVVRMGLHRLAHDRIVELRPNRGAEVARPTLREAREVLAARRLIEAGIVDALCGRLPAGLVESLHALLDEASRAFARGETATWLRLAGEFHLRLARAHGNAELLEALRPLVTRSILVSALYLTPGRTLFAADTRRALLEALGQGGSAARRAAARCIGELFDAIADGLDDAARPERAADVERALRGV